MDVLFPYLPRVTNTPVESNNRLILPVSKYQRIHAEASTEQQYRVGMRDPRRQQQSQQEQTPQQSSQAETSSSAEAETTLLPTGHAVTPEQDQHADAEGHLDIYI